LYSSFVWKKFIFGNNYIDSMGKILSFLGGVLALAGVIGSLFLDYLAWDSLAGTGFTSAIGTAGLVFSDLVILSVVQGGLALLGGLLCLIPKKATCALGGLLILGGTIWFGVDKLVLNGSFSDIWVSMDVHLGFGWMASLLGGLLGLIGAFIGNED
jgi:hypothetical protein